MLTRSDASSVLEKPLSPSSLVFHNSVDSHISLPKRCACFSLHVLILARFFLDKFDKAKRVLSADFDELKFERSN